MFKINNFNKFFVTSLTLVALQTLAETPQNSAEKVIATVNGRPITQAIYDRNLASHPQNAKRDSKELTEELIKRELVMQDAIKRGIDQKPEILAELTTLKENLIIAADLKIIAETISASDEELKKFYGSYAKELINTEYKARHILVASAEEAKTIISQLDQGADFAKLAKEKSKDTAANEGDLGWFSANQMVKPFSEALVKMQKGKYTNEPVKTEFGWHIILLEDTRENPPPPFEQIKDRLKIAVQRAKLQEHIQNLRNTAKVEINN